MKAMDSKLKSAPADYFEVKKVLSTPLMFRMLVAEQPAPSPEHVGSEHADINPNPYSGKQGPNSELSPRSS